MEQVSLLLGNLGSFLSFPPVCLHTNVKLNSPSHYKKTIVTLLILKCFISILLARSCYIPILSADHKHGSDGTYFNFDNYRMNTLALGETLKFNAVNPRTGTFGQVVVWGSPNGGSSGNSHGRFDNKPIASAAKQWRTGDRLVPVNGLFCGTGI